MAKRTVKLTVKFEFQIVPMRKVPPRNPTIFPPEGKRGSDFDGVLQALSKNPSSAVKITRKDSIPLADLTDKGRRGIQSALITISKNRLLRIWTQTEVDAVYAGIEEE
jgi:hypothetical protein